MRIWKRKFLSTIPNFNSLTRRKSWETLLAVSSGPRGMYLPHILFFYSTCPTTRGLSWHVDGVRNKNIFLAHTFTKLPSPVVGVGLRESNSLVLSLNLTFPLPVLIVKAYEETSFANLGAMSVSMAMNWSWVGDSLYSALHLHGLHHRYYRRHDDRVCDVLLS